MAIDSKHPLYDKHSDDWEQLRDGSEGERVVKEKTFQYLKPTSSMVEDGALAGVETEGFRDYEAYISRAIYPEVLDDASQAMLGVMHMKPPTIELPEQMEDLRDRATLDNESLEMLLRRINEEQILMGRIGLFADVVNAGPRAGSQYIATYMTEHIINWDEGGSTRFNEEDEDFEMADPRNLNLVVLDETGFERGKDFTWVEKKKYRVLVLGDPDKNEAESGGTFSADIVTEGGSFNFEQAIQPNISGNVLDQIPFVFVNTRDIVARPDKSPLLGLSNLALSIYRGEADYRQALFMQGQDTFVTIGLPKTHKKIRLGAGAHVNIPSVQGDAKFAGVDSQGLPEIRIALENNYNRANNFIGHVLRQGGAAESGDALRIRVSARAATLNQIALTGAFGLQTILRIIAKWRGLGEAAIEAVIVKPNLDFVDDELTGRTLVEFITAKTMGAPLANETIHEIMQNKGLTQKTFEEEKEAIQKEREEDADNEIGTSNPDGPVDDVDPNDEDESENEDENNDE